MTEYVCECNGMQCKSDDPTSRWCDFGNCNTNWVPIVESEPMDATCSKMETVENDPVNHPSHYTSGRFETIEVIEDWGLDFCLGNAVKYISRAGKKNPDKEIEDLKKAVWYIERRIKQLEGNE